MNYNPNWNNPQQNWNQPPVPPPQPPKSNAKWIIISVVIVVVISGLFYLASSLGKKFGDTFGKITNSAQQQAFQQNEVLKIQEYSDLIYEIQADSALSDSLKTMFTVNLEELKTYSANAHLLIKTYGNGFADTLKGQSTFSSLNKQWAHEYLIKTGRAENLKHALLTLKNETFNHLPPSEQDSSLLYILTVYDNGKDTPAYLNQFTSWESIHFDQPAVTVNLNFNTIKLQVRNFENTMLNRYRNYFYTLH